jgi:hypothetical protein
MKRTLTLATLIALGAAAYAPLPSMAQTSYSFVISSAPPAPLYERTPAPRHGYVWAPGHWEWRGHRHEWIAGYWIAERPGYVYTAPAWYRRDGGWYMEPARWSQYGDRGRDNVAYRGYDGDRDGITERYERDRWEQQRRWEQERRYEHRQQEQGRWDRDRDGVPDRYDRDRDGDGVPNYRDRQPDNPRRY